MVFYTCEHEYMSSFPFKSHCVVSSLFFLSTRSSHLLEETLPPKFIGEMGAVGYIRGMGQVSERGNMKWVSIAQSIRYITNGGEGTQTKRRKDCSAESKQRYLRRPHRLWVWRGKQREKSASKVTMLTAIY